MGPSCKKCGLEYDIENSKHKYCTKCGTAYNHVSVGNLEDITSAPLYKKICDIRTAWEREKYESAEYNLISNGARCAMSQSKDVFLESLKNDFVDNIEQLEFYNIHKSVLETIFIDMFISGYFVWIAEQVLLGNKILPPHIFIDSELESLVNDYDNICPILYDDFIKCFRGTECGGYFSVKSSHIFIVYVFNSLTLYSKNESLIGLKCVLKELQILCNRAMVHGYATAYIDSNYRR